jgi:hypothetical protein
VVVAHFKELSQNSYGRSEKNNEEPENCRLQAGATRMTVRRVTAELPHSKVSK